MLQLHLFDEPVDTFYEIYDTCFSLQFFWSVKLYFLHVFNTCYYWAIRYLFFLPFLWATRYLFLILAFDVLQYICFCYLFLISCKILFFQYLILISHTILFFWYSILILFLMSGTLFVFDTHFCSTTHISYTSFWWSTRYLLLITVFVYNSHDICLCYTFWWASHTFGSGTCCWY